MALRVLDDQGAGTNTTVMLAYSYAGRKGARVLNLSLGGAGYSRSEYELIRSLPNVLFVVAAGNDAANDDRTPVYPCAYELSNVLCVAATDSRDQLASFSNYGPASVDLAAPGTNILSSWPGGGHVYLNGTSMATPHVTGTAALLFGRNPTTSVAAVKNALMQSVDPKPGLAGMVVTGGRLNAARALGIEPPLPPAASPAGPPGGALASRDTKPPRLSLRLRRHGRIRLALRRGIRARVRCSEPCNLRIRVLAGGGSIRRFGLVRGKERAMAGLRLGLGSATRTTVVLRLKRAAKRRLAKLRRAKLLVVASAKDVAGNTSRRQRWLFLRR
jgi:hypothetical protein